MTASDLVEMDSWDLIIIRNEIYARHGYIFKLQKLKDYFSK
ncbi:MAG: YARHG domain-containing protein [Algoriphagus sp.]